MLIVTKRLLGSFCLVGFLCLSCIGLAQGYPSHSPLTGGEAYRIRLTESGVYRISVGDIPALSGLPTHNVTLYGNSGAMLSETNGSGMAHALLNLPFWCFDQNRNGVFDNEDYLLFYGEAVDRWVEDEGRYQYVRHAYATQNCYYLILNHPGRMIDTLTFNSSVSETVATHTVVATHHNDLTNLLQTGQIWVGERFSSTQTSRSFSLIFPTAPTGSTVAAHYAFAHDGGNDAMVKITLNGTTANAYLNGNTPYLDFESHFPASSNATHSIECTYTPTTGTANVYLDYIELSAVAPMRYEQRQTTLRTTGANCSTAIDYRIENVSEGMRAWDITHADSLYEAATQTVSGQSLIQVRDGSPRQILLFKNDQAMRPQSIDPFTPADLAGCAVPDMVIVAPATFINQAERLANLHREIDGLQVLTTTPQAVFDEFSSGKQDPLAFRELLRCYAKTHDGRHPQYLLLFGKGTYDPRNLLGDHGTTLVTCEAYTSFTDNGNAYCSDDPMGYLDDGESGLPTESLEVGIGRLPAKTPNEATHLVDKIERYLTKQDLQENDPRCDWRNTVVLLADDADPGSTYDTIFAHDAELLATSIKNNHPQLNIARIYADAYVQQSGSSGSYYPDVNNALQQHIDYGCLLLNYIGHGSTQYIGTERYITPNDIEAYTNSNRLNFFVTSTCSFGRYDLADDICGAERYLLSDGGGVGLVTATRPIVHFGKFNTLICNLLLNPENSVGDAWRKAKNTHAVSHSIVLLGDPALRLSIPTHRVDITHINQHPVDTVNGDTVSVLSEVTVAGKIVDANGFEDDSFNGSIYFTVYDRETTSRTQANDNEGSEVRFMQQKNVLYRSRDSVKNGQFQYRFIVPMDVASDYATCKLSHYTYDGTLDASGAYTHLFIGGFDTAGTLSTSHPTVRLYLNDTNFRSGGSCDESPFLFAILEDSVGINAVGSGLGHDITAILDGNGNSLITLNDFYTADVNDSRRGTVRYQLSGLTEGWHTLTLKTWNIFNLSGNATIRFYVQKSSEPEVIRFTASPNPATTHTTIRAEHNCPSQISSVAIDIFDMRGRSIRNWQPDSDDSYVAGRIDWDFRDASGQTVPNGIYVVRMRYTIGDKEKTVYTKIIKVS